MEQKTILHNMLDHIYVQSTKDEMRTVIEWKTFQKWIKS